MKYLSFNLAKFFGDLYYVIFHIPKTFIKIYDI